MHNTSYFPEPVLCPVERCGRHLKNNSGLVNHLRFVHPPAPVLSAEEEEQLRIFDEQQRREYREAWQAKYGRPSTPSPEPQANNPVQWFIVGAIVVAGSLYLYLT